MSVVGFHRWFVGILALAVGCGGALKDPCGAVKPRVLASADRLIANPGETVRLEVKSSGEDGSSACDPVQTFDVAWRLETRPAGSNAVVAEPGAQSTTLVPDLPGAYQLSVVATGATGLSSKPSWLTIRVSSCESLAPFVTATADAASVVPGTTVHVSATSTPPETARACAVQDKVTYQWTLDGRPSASLATLSDPTSPSPTFTADAAGRYALRVVATAASGLMSQPAMLEVVAGPCGEIRPSVAGIKASPANVGSAVSLSVAGIVDANCLATSGGYTYAWNIESPSGSRSILTPSWSAEMPTFVPDVPGTYRVSVLVSDTAGASSDIVSRDVVAAPCGRLPPEWASIPVLVSVADPQPSADSQIHAGALVTLRAQFSDPNTCGGVAPASADSFSWVLVSAPAGSRATLSSPTDASPFIVPDVPGAYQIAVKVTNSMGLSTTTAFTTLQTSSCGVNPIVASISPASPLAINSRESHQLVGSAWTGDNQNNASLANYCPPRFSTGLSFNWAITGQPVGAQGSLSQTTGPSSAFFAPAPGAYSVRLTATATDGRSASTTATVNASPCGSNAPQMTSVATTDAATGAVVSRPAVGQAVNLTPLAFDPDVACAGQTLSYVWTYLAAPAGSSYKLPVGDTGPLAFTPDIAGTFAVAVTAVDSSGLSSAPFTVEIVTAPCSPSVEGLGQVPTSGITGHKLSLGTQLLARDVCVASPAALSWEWSFRSRPSGSAASFDAPLTRSASFIPDVPGSYEIRVNVRDDGGNVALQDVSVLVAANRPPVIPVIADQENSSSSPEISIPLPAVDPDGDIVVYSATVSDANVASVSVSAGPVLTLTPLNDGRTAVTLVASDGLAAATSTFSLSVDERSKTWTWASTNVQQQAVRITNVSDHPVSFDLQYNSNTLATATAQLIADARSQPPRVAGSSEPLEEQIWRLVKDRTYHEDPLTASYWQHDPLLLMNSIGWGYCDDVASVAVGLARAAGIQARAWNLNGHVVPEFLRANGAWAMYDPDLSVYYHSRTGDVSDAETLFADPALVSSPLNPIINDDWPYSATVASLYGSTGDNTILSEDFFTPPHPTPRLALPGGASVTFPGLWAAQPKGYWGSTIPVIAQMRMDLLPGTTGIFELPMVPWDVQGGPGHVRWNGVTYVVGSSELTSALQDVLPDRGPSAGIEVLDSSGPVGLVYLINPMRFSMTDAPSLTLRAREVWAFRSDLVELAPGTNVQYATYLSVLRAP